MKQLDGTIINGHFRSPDGAVEFAIAVIYVRGRDRTVAARAIPIPISPGERVIARTPSTRNFKSEYGDYFLYDEDITVEGPRNAYTRYFRLELSTSSLPGASSCLWEFKVRDDESKKAYQAIYRKFKYSLNLGEID